MNINLSEWNKNNKSTANILGFIQFIKSLTGRKIVKLIAKGDAFSSNIGNSRISHLEIIDRRLLEGDENIQI